MNATIAIRRGTARDRSFVIDLGRRVSLTSVSAVRAGQPARVMFAYDRLADYVWTRDHAMIIAEEGGVAAGFALLLFDLPDEVTLEDQAFIAYMAVDPARQRRGIGRELLTTIERLARERGLTHLSLMVTEGNDAARTLYEDAGFATERRLMTKVL
jgi:ribosomal protein S18 acetylase RimI-like enzyme